MSGPTRLALIGAGGRGQSHLDNLYAITDRDFLQRWRKGWPRHRDDFPFYEYEEYGRTVPDWCRSIDNLEATVTAIADPDPESRRQAREICQDNGDDPEDFESADALRSDAEYDAVIVAAPNDEHASIVVPFLAADVDVFCEKPLATTLDDHDRIIEAADRSDGLLYVGFNMRHSPHYSRLRELVHAGVVGELGMLSAHEVRVPFPDGHYYTQEESGGTLLEKDCHDFDMFNWICEAEPARVSAFGGQHILSEGTDVNDHATVIVEYDDGTKGTLELCLYAPFTQASDRVYAARGTDGIVRTGADGNSWDVHGWDTDDNYGIDVPGGSHGGADYRLWGHVLATLAGEAEPLASPTDAKKAAAIAIGAETAILEDRIVEIDENYDLH